MRSGSAESAQRCGDAVTRAPPKKIRTPGRDAHVRLTIEENREAIKRYRHIRPSPLGGSVRCSAMCPGTVRTCTLKRGHPGPHVAHGAFRRVLAVWDKGMEVRRAKETPMVTGRAVPWDGVRKPGPLAALKTLRSRLLRREHTIEDWVFFVLGLSFIGFAIHWILQIIG